ncbi:MAG: hypothetical protein Q9223_003013 [Gallowayella weberi]
MSTEELRNALNTLEKNNITSLDTAFVYPGSEAALGEQHASKRFDIHTKAPSLSPACQSRQSILNGIEKSLMNLNATSVDLYYLHGPDVTTPIEETLSAIQELYTAGKFKRFGISNYLPRDVQKIYDIQIAMNSILPSVYQGNYNAVARHNKRDLIPVLRRLNMNFYAYSPIAGGFLAKDSTQMKSPLAEGRFSANSLSGEMYQSLYGNDLMYKALDDWNDIARDTVNGDGVVIGARNDGQLQQTLKAIGDGPLDEDVAERASGIWEKVKSVAPRDNWNDYLSLKV